jgi:hypothetical protein
MNRHEYIIALTKAGMPKYLPKLEMDREAAKILCVTERTARRYRNGEQGIPYTVQALLRALSRKDLS